MSDAPSQPYLLRNPSPMADSCSINSVFFSLRVLSASLLVVCAGGFSSAPVAGQDPVINRIDSEGWVPGKPVTATVRGSSLQAALALWTPIGTLRPTEGTDLSKDQPVAFTGQVAADAVPGIYPARMVTSHGVSESAWIVAEDLPVIALTEAANSRTAGQPVTLPCAVAGQLGAVSSRFLQITLQSGQTLSAEVYARRLGSSLDPVLRLSGPDGGEVLYADDLPGAEGDTGFKWTADADGVYLLELRDVRYSGGERHHFHLRLSSAPLEVVVAAPIVTGGGAVKVLLPTGDTVGEIPLPEATATGHNLVSVAASIEGIQGSRFASVLAVSGTVAGEQEPNQTQETATPIPAGAVALSGTFAEPGDVDWYKLTAAAPGKLLVTARTRDVGSPVDLVLTLLDASGKQLAQSDDAGPRDAEIEFAVPAAGDYLLKVTELASRGGPRWFYAVDLTVDRSRVVVTTPADRVNVPRGGSSSGVLTLRRVGYDGPLRVELTDLPGGLKMDPIVVGSRQTTVPLTLTSTTSGDVGNDDWGNLSVTVSAPENAAVVQSVQLEPPPAPKNADEAFRSRRSRGDLFVGAAPGLEFSLRSEPVVLKVTQGETLSVKVLATRAEVWTPPIEIAPAAPADQLNTGVTVTAGAMAESELEVKIAAAADAAVGPCVLFLQGKSKKDNTERTLPVPPIQIEVVAKPAEAAEADSAAQ